MMRSRLKRGFNEPSRILPFVRRNARALKRHSIETVHAWFPPIYNLRPIPLPPMLTTTASNPSSEDSLTILGRTLQPKEGIVDWLADFEGAEWPNLPSGEYNPIYLGFSKPEYRKHGDVKRVWDLNKHGHFVDLAKAYKQTGSGDYRNMLVKQFLDWTQRFPYKHGIGWNQPLIVAHRAINWILCFNLGAFPVEVHSLLLSSLLDHGRFLMENLEISDLGINNNHLIGDLVALHLIGLTVGEKRWIKDSLRMLLDEVGKQIQDDGVHYEQSSSYHRYVLEFLTLVWYASKENPKLSFLQETIIQMSHFLNDISYADGSLPFLSDWDGAKVWVANHHRPRELYPLGMKSNGSVPYLYSGYFVLKSPRLHLIFDCGPISMRGKSLQTHGHSDLLSFTLSVDGEPFLIDPGSGTYTQDKQIHDWFRGTTGHNTLTVDGQDQCGLGSFWTFNRHPQAGQIHWESKDDADTVCGEHDAFAPVIHRRAICMGKLQPKVRIVDYLSGDHAHTYEAYFHLAPNLVPTISATKVRIFSSKASVNLAYDDGLSVEVVKGWFAPDYGTWIPAPVLVFKGRSELPVQLAWNFAL